MVMSDYLQKFFEFLSDERTRAFLFGFAKGKAEEGRSGPGANAKRCVRTSQPHTSSDWGKERRRPSPDRP